MSAVSKSKDALKAIGISMALIGGGGTLLDVCTNGAIGCNWRMGDSVKISPQHSESSIDIRCGFLDRNIVGLGMAFSSGIDELGSATVGISFPKPLIFGRRGTR